MTKQQKDYCVNNLAMMVVEKLMRAHPDLSASDCAAMFMGSDTYAKLADHKTRLWAEGPDFILDLYEDEVGP